MKNCIPLIVAAVLLAGGCGKMEEARPFAPQPSLLKPGDSLPPLAPTPRLPVPSAPKGDGVPLPQAGQGATIQALLLKARASRTGKNSARDGNVIGNGCGEPCLMNAQRQWKMTSTHQEHRSWENMFWVG